MSDDVTMVRIYIHEKEQGRRTSLQKELLSLLHDELKVRGATVFRGIAGFGADGEVQSDDLLRLSVDLPVVVEFFDEPAKAEAAIRRLGESVPNGHVVSWRATCRSLEGKKAKPA